MIKHCLRCDKEVEDYWFSFGLPGQYCTPCMDIVIHDHEFLSRLVDEVAGVMIKSAQRMENRGKS